MSNDCGSGPMSLILSTVLPMTDLLKIAAMHYLALPSATCCSSRLQYRGIHRQRVGSKNTHHLECPIAGGERRRVDFHQGHRLRGTLRKRRTAQCWREKGRHGA